MERKLLLICWMFSVLCLTACASEADKPLGFKAPAGVKLPLELKVVSGLSMPGRGARLVERQSPARWRNGGARGRIPG